MTAIPIPPWELLPWTITLSGGQLALIIVVYFFLGFFIGGILHK
jgi:hypothetical protein